MKSLSTLLILSGLVSFLGFDRMTGCQGEECYRVAVILIPALMVFVGGGLAASVTAGVKRLPVTARTQSRMLKTAAVLALVFILFLVGWT